MGYLNSEAQLESGQIFLDSEERNKLLELIGVPLSSLAYGASGTFSTTLRLHNGGAYVAEWQFVPVTQHG
jgi:hypothetical protein